MSKKRVASQAERFKLGKLLEEHIIEDHESRCVSYANDMTDTKIAALIGAHISPSTVQNMRQHIFGPLRKPASSLGIEARINRLETLFDYLALEVGSDLRVDPAMPITTYPQK